MEASCRVPSSRLADRRWVWPSAQAQAPKKGSPEHIKAATSAVDDGAIKANATTTKDWLSYGLDYSEMRFSQLDQVNADNTQTPLYGSNPAGTLIFTANGQYSSQIFRTTNRVKYAANDRLKGTAAEHKAAAEGAITHFGTWSVDEGAKTITFRIESSSYPNWDGTVQKRSITGYNQNDVLTYTNSTPATGTLPVLVAWKWIP